MALGKKGGDEPRVVGFDFGPPAPAPAPPPAWVAESVGEHVADAYPPPEYPPPAFPPPVFQPPAYEPPARPAPDSLAGYLGPVSTIAAPSPAAPPQASGESDHRFWRAGAEMPPAWSETTVAPPPRRGTAIPVKGVVSVVVTALVAAGAYRGYQRFSGDELTRPESIAGYQLISNNVVDGLAEGLQREMAGEISRPLVAVYGVGDLPHFVLVAGDARDKDSRKMYADLVRQLDTGTQVGQVTAVGDVLCSSVTRGTDSMTICFWASDRGADGVVMHLGALRVHDVGIFANQAKDALR